MIGVKHALINGTTIVKETEKTDLFKHNERIPFSTFSQQIKAIKNAIKNLINLENYAVFPNKEEKISMKSVNGFFFAFTKV